MEANSENNDVALVSCMRNEGLFVLEWLAYHSLLGFKKIVVFTNNCIDHSDRLLSRLQELGHIKHIEHSPAPGTSPQINAMRIAFEDPDVRACEWLLHIDADEFLVVTVGQKDIHSLIDAVGPTDVVAIAWNVFGTSGLESWSGGSIIETFLRCQGQPMRRTVNHKSLYRHAKFERGTDHMPKGPLVEKFVVRNTAGAEIPGRSIFHRSKSRYKAPFHQITFENAYINHYALKTDDLYLMKNDRGDGHGISHNKYYLNSQFYRRYNRNENEDRTILERLPEVEALVASYLEDPEIRRLNDACLAAYIERRDKVLTPEQIAAWTASPDESEDTTP